MATKHDYGFIVDEYRKRGLIVLDQDYLGAHTPITCRCEQGHEIKLSWVGFKQGVGCAKCKGNAKLTYEEVRAIFEKNDCKLISETYTNSITPLEYICKCGNASKIRLGDFNQGKRCRQCSILKGEKHPRYNHDRGKHDLYQKVSRQAHDALKCSLRYLGKKKVEKTSSVLGYSTQQLIDRLTEHVDWPKLKDGDWSMDHVFPIKAFMDHGIFDLRLINHLDNLQPMLRRDNSSKNDKYDDAAFKNWLAEHGVV